MKIGKTQLVKTAGALSLAAALLSAAGPSPAAAQDELDGPHRIFQDSLLDSLVGDWDLSGKMAHYDLKQHVTAQWVLNHQFLKIDFRETAEPPVATVRYEGTEYIGYNNRELHYVMHLLDVWGGRYSETLGYGEREGDAIRFVFDYPDGLFHLLLTWHQDSGTWDMITLEQKPDGSWSTFSEKHLRRTK
jgi:hypothetical protein